MGALLEAFPGARRALFAKYHVGGCASCGFQPDETLGQVCARNDDMPVEEAIAHLLASQENDAAMQVSAKDLQAALALAQSYRQQQQLARATAVVSDINNTPAATPETLWLGLV